MFARYIVNIAPGHGFRARFVQGCPTTYSPGHSCETCYCNVLTCMPAVHIGIVMRCESEEVLKPLFSNALKRVNASEFAVVYCATIQHIFCSIS